MTAEPGRPSRYLLGAVLGFVLPLGSARAEAAKPSVWYRYSGDCPSGEGFLARLRTHSVEARLAGVGDPVDFVVTMGTSNGTSQGRLERQTAAGTVAIRDVEAAQCPAVADALALTLVLTWAPDESAGRAASVTPAPPPGEESRPPGSTNPSSDEGSRSQQVAAAASSAATSTSTDVPLAGEEGPLVVPQATRWRLGAQLGAAAGLSPALQPRGGLWLTYGHRSSAGDIEGRGTALAGYGSSETARGDLRVGLTALRAEGCVLAWTEGEFGVQPCGGLEGGYLLAKGPDPTGSSDGGPWAAVVVSGRGSWRLAHRFGLELSFAATVPWWRYEYSDPRGRDVTYSVKAVGVDAGLGAFLVLD